MSDGARTRDPWDHDRSGLTAQKLVSRLLKRKLAGAMLNYLPSPKIAVFRRETRFLKNKMVYAVARNHPRTTLTSESLGVFSCCNGKRFVLVLALYNAAA